MSARAWAYPRASVGWALVAVILLIAVAIIASAVVFALRGPETGFVFFPFGFGWLFVLLFFLFFWGFRWWGGWSWHGRPYGPYRVDGAKAILRERYARGEIGKDQFDEIMRDLDRHA